MRKLVGAVGETVSGVTDDLGEYRFYGLGPGTYYVRVAPKGTASSSTAYVPIYFPGTPVESAAQAITLGPGEQRLAVNLQIIPVPAASVSGTVVAASVVPLTGSANLAPVTQSSWAEGRSARLDATGHFVIKSVPPGDYLLWYHPDQIQDPDVSVPTPVTVSGSDISNLTLQLTRGAAISGRLTIEGEVPAGVQLTSLQVGAMTAEPALSGVVGAQNAKLDDRGEFVLTHLSGQVLIRASGVAPARGGGSAGGGGGQTALPESLVLKAVRLNGQDVTDGFAVSPDQNVIGLDVVLTSRLSSISGIAVDDRAKPAADADVVAFSPDSARWGYRTRYVSRAHADKNGHFEIRGLPAGDYLVAGVSFLAVGGEGDPAVLEGLRRYAMPVHLGDGDSKTVSFQLSPDGSVPQP